MNRPDENAIRDFLADHLDMIEPGLVLVESEHYLRNSHGAAGFLDILACDRFGNLIIIEIKRTDSAAREAIQELYKYAALLRDRYLLRDVEYRLVLLSVKWHELHVPYSEFKQTAPFDVSAGCIVLDSKGWPERVDPVNALATAKQRKFSTRHFLWRFDSEDKASSAVALISGHMASAGLQDFVLIRSQSNNLDIRDKVFLYFAQQEMGLADYMERIRRQVDMSEYQDLEVRISDLTEEEDRVAEAADAVWYPGYDALPIDSDTSEISHPEKAVAWFSADAQRGIVVHRYGRFTDARLSDETIISELIGHGGESDYHLRLRASTASRPQMQALRSGIANAFFFNAEWRNACLDLLHYASGLGPAVVDIKAFSNEDILRSIAGAAFGYPGYVPTFRFEIEREGHPNEVIMGLPEWDGTLFDFDLIIQSHFESDPFSYFTAHNFGLSRRSNADLMADLGLRYLVFWMGDTGPESIRVVGSTIVSSPRAIKGSLPGLIEANKDEVHKIVALFMEHDNGFARTIEDWLNDPFNLAEREIESRIGRLHSESQEHYWNGKIVFCDLCARSFASAQFMIDAHVCGGGANVCAQCYLETGDGHGMIFVLRPKGWLMLGVDSGPQPEGD